MSQTSTLISCTGRITRAELANLPTPPATATHIPIPHSAVVETLAEALSHRHIGVVGAEFALMVKKVIRVRWKSMTGGNLRSFWFATRTRLSSNSKNA